MTLKLGTIAEEAAACRERWKGYDTGTLAAHLHHDVAFEMLYQLADLRIAYILEEKPEHERALRLRCFAPVDLARFPKLRQAYAAWEQAYAAREQAYAAWKQADAAWKQAYAAREQTDAAWKQAYAALRNICDVIPHAELCPLGKDCPWDGETIFRIARTEK